MRKHDSFEDDGRTIADMSGIGPTPTLLPHSRKPAAAAHIGDGTAIVLKRIVLSHFSYRWQTT